MEWTRTAIAADTRAWLAALPERLEREGFTLVHGSPRDPIWEYVTSTPVARAGIAAMDTPFGLHGHTHVPVAYLEDDGHLETMSPGAGSRITFGTAPGAAQPGQRRAAAGRRSRPPRGCSSTRTTAAATWHRTAYDVGVVQAAMEAPGPAGAARRAAGVRAVTPMIGGRRPISGRKPGDKRVRVERYHAPYFRYTGPEPAHREGRRQRARRRRWAGSCWRTKAILIGKPLANEEEIGERLSKKKALAIFSSDAISSSAYATEEILLAFLLAGVGGAAFLYSIQVSIGIAVLLGIVAFSYRQVCIAYPTGGGSYSVSKANIGRLASLVAASALLIDYTLTVAVSTSSAVEQIASAFPALDPVKVEIGILAIALITLGNLRGPARGRQHLRDPDLPVPVLGVPDDRHRHVPDPVPGRHGPAPTPEVMAAMQDTASGADDPHPPAGVRVGRRRAHGDRGDRDRRARVPAARGPQRRPDADGRWP